MVLASRRLSRWQLFDHMCVGSYASKLWAWEQRSSKIATKPGLGGQTRQGHDKISLFLKEHVNSNKSLMNHEERHNFVGLRIISIASVWNGLFFGGGRRLGGVTPVIA